MNGYMNNWRGDFFKKIGILPFSGCSYTIIIAKMTPIIKFKPYMITCRKHRVSLLPLCKK